MKPLADYLVLDFTKVFAGPLCAQYLGDLGADVIKLEPVGHGDNTRLWPPFCGNVGTVFLSCNRNKGSIAVDLKTDAGKSIVLRRGGQRRQVSRRRSRLSGLRNRGADPRRNGLCQGVPRRGYFRESMLPRIAPVSPQLIFCFIAEKVLGLPKSYCSAR